MDLMQFNTTEKGEQGVFIPLKHPKTKNPLLSNNEPVGVIARSYGSKAVQEKEDELNREWAEICGGEEKKKPTERQAYEGREKLIAATVGFQNITIDGKKLTGDPKDIRQFYLDPGFEEFHVQVLNGITKSANFMKGAAKGS